MALTTITVRVAAAAQGFSSDMAAAFAGATVQVQNFEEDTKKSTDKITAMTVAIGTAFTELVKTIAKAVIAMGRDLIGFIDEAVTASAKFNEAIIGLRNTASSWGQSADAATEAAHKLAADGLLPLNTAADSLKRLLGTGFDLKQSVDMMNAFKDAAAFARSSTYGFAESVEMAAESLQKHRSRGVQTVGIMEKITDVMKEAGFKIQDLDDKTKSAEAHQALYNGVLRLAAAAHGDAARFATTYNGALLVLKNSWTTLLAAIGDFITRNAVVTELFKTVGLWVSQLTTYLLTDKEGFYLVADAIIYTVQAMSALLQMVDYVQQAYTKLRVVFDAVGQSIAYFAIAVLTASQKAAQIEEYTDPWNAKLYKKEAADIGDALTFLHGAVTGFKEDQSAAGKASAEWSDTIQAAKLQLDQLTTRMEAARGKTVDLGKATKDSDTNLHQLADTVDKMSKADISAYTKSLRDQINYTAKLIEIREKDAADREKAQEQADWEFTQNVYRLAREAQAQERTDEEIRQDAEATYSYVVAQVRKVSDAINKAEAKVVDPLDAAFVNLARELPRKMFDAMKSGTSMFEAIGGSFADAFGNEFQKVLKKHLDDPKLAWSLSEKMTGYISTAITAAVGGYSVGQASGSKSKGLLGGILGGAAAGAAIGLPAGGPTLGLSVAVGAAAGGIAGLIGGIFGGQAKADKAMNDLRAAKQALLDQVGGFKALKAEADSVGVSFDAIYNATNIDQFNAAVKTLNDALAQQKKNVDAIGAAMDAINARAADFAAPFQATLDAMQKAKDAGNQTGVDDATKQLMAQAEAGQAEFERLGLYIKDAFSGFITNGGTALDAITKMTPAFQVLQDGVSKFGLTSSAVIDELLADFNLVNDDGMKPLFQQISDTGAILQNLMSANALSPEGFQAAAADIGASIQGIIDKGGDVSRTLALSQPVLQSLWEAQQKYGAITDDTTKSLLDQAEQQGLVGENMKSVNEKILDVLIAIGKVLGADLPQDFKTLSGAAQTTADDIEGSFNGIQIEPVKIEYQTSVTGDTPPVPMARGGIVRRPTLALIGEGGPEAVVPLSGKELGLTGTGGTAILEVDGRKLAEVVVPQMPGVIKRYGLQ
jgi:hypothetical protein